MLKLFGIIEAIEIKKELTINGIGIRENRKV
jgi:hypothetical protein